MVAEMPSSKDERRQAKIIVNARVDPSAVARLDEIAEEMRPQPSRSEMVALAIEEFVERHGTPEKKPRR